MVAPVAESKSPDKYTINKNLVVNLNDSVVKPVKRENSNTTNATGVTGITASTAGTTNTKHNAAFYNTQYKGSGAAKGSFFQPPVGTAASGNRNNAYLGNYMGPNTNVGSSMEAEHNYDEANHLSLIHI